LAKARLFKWKLQIRDSESFPWRTVDTPQQIRYESKDGYHRTNNEFYIKDGQAIPEEAYSVYGGLPSPDYFVRTILDTWKVPLQNNSQDIPSSNSNMP
jgi:hypothetical protein